MGAAALKPLDPLLRATMPHLWCAIHIPRQPTPQFSCGPSWCE